MSKNKDRFLFVVLSSTIALALGSVSFAADPAAPASKPSAAPSVAAPAAPAPTNAPAAAGPQVKAIAKLIRPPAAQQLPGLRFVTEDLQVLTEGKDDFVYIEGEFPDQDWTLLLGPKMAIKRNATGRFKIKAKLNAQVTTLNLGAVSPKGEVKKELVKINFATWKSKVVVSRHSLTPSVGYSILNFSQEYVTTNSNTASKEFVYTKATLAQTALTAKIGYTYQLAPPRWDMGVTFFMNALTFGPKYEETASSNGALSSKTGISARFYGLNIRIGYVVPFIGEPWRVILMPGFYYTGAMVTGASFGYSNLMGPQFFPVVRRMIGSDALSAYFKFAPIYAGGVTSGSDSLELAAGLTYSLRLKNGHFVPITFDWADLKLRIPATTTTDAKLNSRSISFGLGYSL